MVSLPIVLVFRVNNPNRVPFYYLVKTLFLLYLALPQTRGSSYLYIYHLQPFFHTHESQIDATLASFKTRIYTFIQERFRSFWVALTATMGQQQQTNSTPAGGVAATGVPPTLADPASGPAQLVWGLWRSYGPTIVASGTALLRQGAAAAETSGDRAWNSPANTYARRSDAGRQSYGKSLTDRKRELEAELAFINSADQPGVPIPSASGSFQSSSRASSDSELRERGSGNVGRFEEVDVPSDAEGYDVDGSGREDHEKTAKAASWFGWGSGASNKGGKSD